MNGSRIGFIGLGLMGSALVGRLQEMGHSLTVAANVTRTGVEAAVARGAAEVRTGREVAAASDIVMLCMATSEQVENRMRGPDGVIAGLRKGAVVIDFGTSLPESTRTLGEEVARAGGEFLDAPLGGTPAHAKEGMINIMGAGDGAAFSRIKPVLDDLGKNVFLLGPLGTGHTVKLINNFFAQCVANAMAEAFVMADRTGVDRQTLHEVMSAGPLKSGMMDFIKAYAVGGNPDMLAFSIKNALKDVGYYRRMALDTCGPSVMAESAFGALSDAVAQGRGELMVPQMVDYFSDRYGS